MLVSVGLVAVAPYVLPSARGELTGHADGGAAVVGLGGTVHIEVRSDGTVRTTVHHWGWWTVVRCRVLVNLFKFKFDRLNMNLTI
jgi:hypothetical protein